MPTVSPRPKTIPLPEGFTPVRDALRPELLADYYEGPSASGDGWVIETTFTFETGVKIEMLTPDGYGLIGLRPDQAFAAGVALAQIGHRYSGHQ